MGSALASPQVVHVERSKEHPIDLDIAAVRLLIPLGSSEEGNGAKVITMQHSVCWQRFDHDRFIVVALENGKMYVYPSPGRLQAASVHRMSYVDADFTGVKSPVRLFLMFPGGGRYVFVTEDNRVRIRIKHEDSREGTISWRSAKIGPNIRFTGDTIRWITSATLELSESGDVPRRLQERKEGSLKAPVWEIIEPR